MAIGERIHHFRLLHGFTQKYLGQMLALTIHRQMSALPNMKRAAAARKKNI